MHYLAGRATAEQGPSFHEGAALFESITATVRAFGLIADKIGQGRFRHSSAKFGAFTGPVAESTAKAVHRSVDFLRRFAAQPAMPSAACCCPSLT
jgi:hypothetical protein